MGFKKRIIKTKGERDIHKSKDFFAKRSNVSWRYILEEPNVFEIYSRRMTVLVKEFLFFSLLNIFSNIF